MRIAQVSTVGTPVSRDCSGSIESHVWLLSRELTALGHEVTVFGLAGSEPAGELVATLAGGYGKNGSPDDWHVCEWINLCRAVEQSGRFDVIHAHAYLWGLPLEGLSRCPMVHTLHVLPGANEAKLLAAHPKARVTAISRYQWQGHPAFEPAATIHHGVDASQFTFRPRPEGYVCYMGRFMPGKGPLLAIRAARALGLRLLLAGPASDYYRREVAPLVDGEHVHYIGSVTGSGRDQLLGGARALLYPVRTPEPFGLVMPEAMACGTPVVSFDLGAVTEIVDEGITGCIATGEDDFIGSLLRALELDRENVRRRALERFSPARMARQYVRVFESVAGHA